MVHFVPECDTVYDIVGYDGAASDTLARADRPAIFWMRGRPESAHDCERAGGAALTLPHTLPTIDGITRRPEPEWLPYMQRAAMRDLAAAARAMAYDVGNPESTTAPDRDMAAPTAAEIVSAYIARAQDSLMTARPGEQVLLC